MSLHITEGLSKDNISSGLPRSTCGETGHRRFVWLRETWNRKREGNFSEELMVYSSLINKSLRYTWPQITTSSHYWPLNLIFSLIFDSLVSSFRQENRWSGTLCFVNLQCEEVVLFLLQGILDPTVSSFVLQLQVRPVQTDWSGCMHTRTASALQTRVLIHVQYVSECVCLWRWRYVCIFEASLLPQRRNDVDAVTGRLTDRQS